MTLATENNILIYGGAALAGILSLVAVTKLYLLYLEYQLEGLYDETSSRERDAAIRRYERGKVIYKWVKLFATGGFIIMLLILIVAALVGDSDSHFDADIDYTADDSGDKKNNKKSR